MWHKQMVFSYENPHQHGYVHVSLPSFAIPFGDDPHLSSRRKCRVTSTEPSCNRSMLHNLAAELNWPKCGFFLPRNI